MIAKQVGGSSSGSGLGKSSTLPRNMGSKSGPNPAPLPNRGKILTPLAGKKVVGSGAVVGSRKPSVVGGAASQSQPAGKPKPHSIRSCDTKLAQLILDEVIEGGSAVTWDDISGQEV
jgi:spastin